MPKSKIFVSHISKEAALAEVLQKHIQKHFLGLIEVFVSSDGVSIEAGSDWLKSLKEALQEAQAVIVLCSKESVGRPWVNFEAGAAWLKDVPIIPVCHTDLKPEQIPLPLQLLQAVEAGQAGGIRRLYARLANTIGADEPEVDHEQIAAAVRLCEQEYRRAAQGAALERVTNPRILCAASKQYATVCEYEKDLAAIRQTFPGATVVNEGALTAPRLRELLTEQQFDIVHLVNYVDAQTGALIFSDFDVETRQHAGDPDELSAEGFAKLVEVSGVRLAVLASCDSMRLGAKLARVTNMVAAYSGVQTKEIVAWESDFYRMLARGHALTRAFEVSSATCDVPMCLMLKKDAAFAPEPAAGRV